MIDKKLLDILACPICKSPLRYRQAEQELICRADRLAFPIQDEIPVCPAHSSGFYWKGHGL